MKINDAIVAADELRMNTLDDEQKAKWLYELDCAVAEIMGKAAPTWKFPENKELLIPMQHEEVYVKYLVAMIDYYNGESELYANDITLYEQAMKEFRSWYIRNNRPRSAGGWVV